MNAPMSMHATLMHFSIWLPDWNSLDSVRHAHSVLEIAALVFFALLVLFDILAHFSEDKSRERLLEKIALCFFAVAVIAEIVAYPYGQRNDTLSEQIIGSLDDKTREAENRANTARADSSTALGQAKDALDKAGKAQESLGKAESEANNAQSASANAMGPARGARQEADSFELDIKSAKRQAAGAESHLAEALKEAAEAQAELNLLKTSRSLTNVAALISALHPFKGTKFSFLGIYGDQESIDLAQEINDALQRAEWKPTRAPNAGGVNSWIWLKNFPVAIVPSLGTGLRISVESEEKIETLKASPPSQLPQHVQAALALRGTLASSISPSQDDLASAPVEVTNSAKPLDLVVLIVVGKKPYSKKIEISNK